jgi:PAS domain S-box-containing protein
MMKLLSLSQSSRHIFLLAALGAGIMTAGVIGLLLNDVLDKKNEVFETARSKTEFKARLMSDHATRTFETVDVILFGLSKDIAHDSSQPTAQQTRLRLHERLLFLPQVLTLALYDATGNLLVDTKRLDANENVANQSFFIRHRNEGVLFLLEGPLPRRFDLSGRGSLRLSRLISGSNGQFQGVLLAEIDPGYFRSFYREEDPFGEDFVALLDSDGRIMSSEQPEVMPPGKLISDLAILEGIDLTNRAISGLQRIESEGKLVVLNQLANFPLRIAIVIDKEHLLSGWRESVRKTWLIVLGVLLAYGGALGLIGFLLHRRTVAEAALRLSEAHLRAIHDHADIGIIRADPFGRILVVNPAFAKMLGASPQDLVGLNVQDITHPDDQALSVDKLTEMRQGRCSRYCLEKRYRRLDNGATVWGRISVFTVNHDEVSPSLTFGMVEDITESKRNKETVEALLRRSQLLLSAVGEGILGLDASGRVAFVNPASEAILGYTGSEMIGKPSHDLIHRRHLDGTEHDVTTCPIHAVLSDGKSRQTSHDSFWRKDGAMVPVEYIATPLMSDTGIEGAVIAFRDISRRFAAESEIKRSNAELEQFAYAVSHDLQEPLRMVASYVQLLGRRYQGKLDKDADDFIGFAVDGAKRMQQMITDLLEYSRVQRKGNPMAPVEMDQPLKAALQNLELAITESKAEILVDSTMPKVVADSAQMSRLFQNLIGNAVKYRDPQRPLTIRIAASCRDSLCTFSISDNGIGIDPQYFERIFQVFQRLHARTDYPGTGIGLAICRKIVERHGGKIWLESTPGVGSTFFFTLPAA